MTGRRILVVALCAWAGAARGETFVLDNGDSVSGEVVEWSDETVVVENPVLGRLEIPAARIAPARPVRPGLFGSSLLRGWKREVSVSFAGAEGNAVSSSVGAALNLGYEDDFARWDIGGAYAYGSSNHGTDRNQAFFQAERDWLRPDSRWSWFAQSRYDYDQFRAFHQRIGAFTGPGYRILDWDSWKLSGKLGGGGSYQWDGETELRPEALVGLTSVWKVGKLQTLTLATQVFPDLLDLGAVRTLSSADWAVDVSQAVPIAAILEQGAAVALKFGVVHEYQSDTDRKKSDLTYQGALSYSF